MRSELVSMLVYNSFKWYGLLHPIKKKVVFSSFFGKQYSDNPRAICETMHRLYPDYELVWLLDRKDNEIIPDYVRVVSRRDRFFAWGREIVTAASFVYNFEMRNRFFRRKAQTYIQTWHGDRAIKKILKDCNPNTVLYENQLTSLCVAGSEAGEKMYRSAFGYEGEVLKTGSPRNDCLFNITEKEKQAMKKRLGIPLDAKVMLYAPTFRDNAKGLQESMVDVVRTLNTFPQDEKWICLVRAHIASSGLSGNYEDTRIYNVTAYPDMADILCITDFLITDYSSCATDYALTGKPIILALFDKEQYKENCRAFFAEPETIGFVVAYNQEELEQRIRDTSEHQYSEACQMVNKFYGTVETGHAAEDVCHFIDAYYNKMK